MKSNSFLLNLIFFGNKTYLKERSYEFTLFDLSSTQLRVSEGNSLFIIELRDHEDKLTSISKCMFGGGVKKPHQHLLVLNLELLKSDDDETDPSPPNPPDINPKQPPTDSETEDTKKKGFFSKMVSRIPNIRKKIELKAQVVPMDLITTQIALSDAYELRNKKKDEKHSAEIKNIDVYYQDAMKKIEARYKKQIESMRAKMVEMEKKNFDLEIDQETRFMNKLAQYTAFSKKSKLSIIDELVPSPPDSPPSEIPPKK